MKLQKFICVFFLLITNNSFSQKNGNVKIYGKWSVYYEVKPFRGKENKNVNSIWFFQEDGNLFINDAKYKYELNDEGTEFMLNNDKYLYKVIDTILRIEIKILPHESQILKLKKIIK